MGSLPGCGRHLSGSKSEGGTGWSSGDRCLLTVVVVKERATWSPCVVSVLVSYNDAADLSSVGQQYRKGRLARVQSFDLRVVELKMYVTNCSYDCHNFKRDTHSTAHQTISATAKVSRAGLRSRISRLRILSRWSALHCTQRRIVSVGSCECLHGAIAQLFRALFLYQTLDLVVNLEGTLENKE